MANESYHSCFIAEDLLEIALQQRQAAGRIELLRGMVPEARMRQAFADRAGALVTGCTVCVDEGIFPRGKTDADCPTGPELQELKDRIANYHPSGPAPAKEPVSPEIKESALSCVHWPRLQTFQELQQTTADRLQEKGKPNAGDRAVVGVASSMAREAKDLGKSCSACVDGVLTEGFKPCPIYKDIQQLSTGAAVRIMQARAGKRRGQGGRRPGPASAP